jgi:hypothetical protein
MNDQKTDKKEIVSRIREAVELVKKSGSPDINTACTSRAAAIGKLLSLVRELSA